MAQNNKEIIQLELVDKISRDIKKLFPPKDIQKLLSKTNQLLQKVNNLEKKWKASQNAQKRSMGIIDGTNYSKTSVAWRALYSDPTQKLQYNDILKIIIETEIFLDEVRKYFTGQEITFSVGLSYYSKLYEYNLTLLDMLKNAVIAIDSKSQGLKLRITRSKSTLIQAYGTLEAKVSVIDKQYEQSKTNESLYQILRERWLKDGKKINGKVVNEGVLYETYRYYVESGITDINFNKKEDRQFYEHAIIRSMNSTSGRQGGDVNQSQVKFVNASFATISNIRNTLKELSILLINFIKSGSQEEFSKGLKKLFTKNDKDIEEIESDSQREAKEYIDKIINNMLNIKLT